MAHLFPIDSFGATCKGMRYITFRMNGIFQDEQTVPPSPYLIGQSQYLESIILLITACMFDTLHHRALSQSSLILGNDEHAQIRITKCDISYFAIKMQRQSVNYHHVIFTAFLLWHLLTQIWYWTILHMCIDTRIHVVILPEITFVCSAHHKILLLDVCKMSHMIKKKNQQNSVGLGRIKTWIVFV